MWSLQINLRQAWPEISLDQWLSILFVLLFIIFAIVNTSFRRFLAELDERFRNGPPPGGGHPVPATGSVEKSFWEGLIRSLRHRHPRPR